MEGRTMKLTKEDVFTVRRKQEDCTKMKVVGLDENQNLLFDSKPIITETVTKYISLSRLYEVVKELKDIPRLPLESDRNVWHNAEIDYFRERIDELFDDVFRGNIKKKLEGGK
jgi:hypothetical protein